MTSQMDTGCHRGKRSPRSGGTRSGYLWLLGLVAPTALFVVLPMVWAFNQLGLERRVAGVLLDRPVPDLRAAAVAGPDFGPDGQNPPDEVMERLENDKYYRYCTYVFIPFQFASVIFGAYLFTASNLSWLGYDGRLSWAAKIGLALSVGVLGGIGINTAHEMGHKKDVAGALAVEDHPGADVLRPLLHRAQPRPPRPRRHPRGPGLVAVRGDVLGVPAAQRVGQCPLGMEAGGHSGCAGSARARGTGSNDVLNAWVMSVVFWGVLIAVFGPALIPFVDHPGGLRVRAAGDRSTTSSTTGCCGRRTPAGATSAARPQHSWNSDHS